MILQVVTKHKHSTVHGLSLALLPGSVADSAGDLTYLFIWPLALVCRLDQLKI